VKRSHHRRPSTIPQLGPGGGALRELVQMPLAVLRAAAEQRGLAVPAGATRPRIARLLIIQASRAQAEARYRDTGIAFDARDAAYPHLRRLVVRHRLRHILDLGCGPGLFAEELRAAGLPRGGSYRGIDVSPAAVALARQRLSSAPQFTFEVGDAEDLRRAGPAGPAIDGIVLGFVLSYLDTRAVHRLLGTLAGRFPRAALVIALTFLSCVDRHDGIEPGSAGELRAARRYLAGDDAAAGEWWDVRRWLHYRRSLEAYYRVTEERILSPAAQILWVARPHSGRVIVRRSGQ
jgi:SAM-dependent methyltransferase